MATVRSSLKQLLPDLVEVVGPDHVLSDPDLKAPYESDWTGRWHGNANVVIRPGTTSQVSAVMGILSNARVAVVPQGGNTGLVGGGVPRGGEAVISLRRLDHLGPVDKASAQVNAGAGVTLARLQAHARAAGLLFGVDLAARDSATIGGMVATNAGGIHVLRYGMMRAQVVGAELVMADGSVVRRMSGLKENTGYDLVGLATGSEGTLAIVTEARLRLVAEPGERVVAMCGVADLEAAIALTAALRNIASLEALEVLDSQAMAIVRGHTGLPSVVAGDWEWYVLMECAGDGDLVAALHGAITSVEGVSEPAVALEPARRADLWSYRERLTESISALGIPHKLDVAIPLKELGLFAKDLREHLHALSPQARPVLFGHLAEGNLHVNILGLSPSDSSADEMVLHLAADHGGTISSEHGVGIAKQPWLALTRSQEDRSVMRAIKQALDPDGLLNPGVLFGLEPYHKT